MQRGKRRAATAQAARAFKHVAASLPLEDGEAAIRLTMVECLLARDREKEALACLKQAVSRLHERAQAIGEPALRESFLTRIPDHRRTLDLATNRLDPRDLQMLPQHEVVHRGHQHSHQ